MERKHWYDFHDTSSYEHYIDKLYEILGTAREGLGEYMFSEDGEYNNEEVIHLCKEIDSFLKGGD